MFCQNCGKEMDDKLKTCPNCGNPTKPKKKKVKVMWVVPAVIAAFVLIGVLSSGGSDDEPHAVNNGETVSANATTESAETEPAATEKSAFTVGDAVENDGVTVTLKSVEESMGDEFFKPDSGKVFVLCEFEIENNSDEGISVSSIMSFEAYCDDYAVDMDFSATSATDKSQLDGSVAPGKKMSGVIGYEVPQDWKALEVHYIDNVWSPKPIVFTYSK